MTPLSAPLPLRTTTAWDAFRAAAPIPHRYGETCGELLQYNEQRTEFVWADHAVQAIDAVYVEGQAVGDWQWLNTTDTAGHPIALVRFGQAQDEGATLSAAGRGKLHPVTGQLMTNPADVVLDVLAGIAGRSISSASLDAFRRACEAAELTVGGSLASATETVRGVVRGICASIGAVFGEDMRGLCRLWPGGVQDASRATVRDGDVSASSAIDDDFYTDLTVAYSYDGDEPRATVQLEAPEMVRRYGRKAVTLEARWISSARVAAAVAYRLLAFHARPQWAVSVTPARVLAVGDTVTLAHPQCPVAGAHIVLARDYDVEAGTARVSVRAAAGDAPALRIVRQAAAFEPAQYAGVGVTTVGGERVLTLREETGLPIVGAAVTLDGTLSRTTDATGRVSFPVASMPAGEHVLIIVTADGRRLTTTVLIP